MTNKNDMQIESVFSEESTMTVDQMVDLLEKGIKQYFPNSMVNVRYSPKFGETISIGFALGRNESEWTNGISANDPLSQSIVIYGIHNKQFLPSLRVDAGTSSGKIRTRDGQIIKVGWRKKSGTPEDIVKHILAYFSKLKSLAQQHKKDIIDLGGHL